MNINLLKAGATYATKRAAYYPKFAEQMDKLWHDIDNGTLTTSGDFYTKLKVVKDKYAKE